MVAKSKVVNKLLHQRWATFEKTGLNPERRVLDRLSRELLGVCGTALLQFHADPGKRARSVLRGFPRRAEYAAKILDDVDKLSLIHTQWRRKTGYFDEDGLPKIISVSGPALSYKALCADFGFANEYEHLLSMALAFRMCCHVDNDRLRYLSEVALFTGIPVFILARTVVNIERFLKTNRFNAKPGRKLNESLVDRTAAVQLSEEQFEQFAVAMRGILHDFIESSDRRLLAGVARDSATPKKRLRRRFSGVTAFIFRE